MVTVYEQEYDAGLLNAHSTHTGPIHTLPLSQVNLTVVTVIGDSSLCFIHNKLLLSPKSVSTVSTGNFFYHFPLAENYLIENCSQRGVQITQSNHVHQEIPPKVN